MCLNRKGYVITNGVYVRGVSLMVKLLFLEFSSSPCYSILFLYFFAHFLIPLSWRISHIIQSIPSHFHRTLVHHPALHSSMCPIKHLFWLFYERQWLKTLFKGLLHINATRKAAVVHLMRWWQLFLKIFLYPYQLRTCLESIFIVGISWKITQVTRMPA